MTEPAATGQAHDRLAQAVSFADVVLDAVTPQLLSQPTPCRACNLRMLLEHAGESLAALYEGFIIRRVAVTAPQAEVNGPSSAAGLVSTFRVRAAALLDASAEADGDAQVTIGDQPMPLGCLCTTGALEITMHAWDISQACGQCLPIPDEAAADLLTEALVLVPTLDRYPLFAAPVPVPPGSTASDRLAAYLGRSVAVEAAKARSTSPGQLCSDAARAAAVICCTGRSTRPAKNQPRSAARTSTPASVISEYQRDLRVLEQVRPPWSWPTSPHRQPRPGRRRVDPDFAGGTQPTRGNGRH